MSYLFTSDSESGTFTTAIDISTAGLTCAAFIKLANHPETLEYILSLSFDTALDDFVAIQLGAAADQYRAQIYDTTGAGSGGVYNATAGTYDNTWIGLVATYNSAETSRTIYVDQYSNSATNSPTSRPTTTLGEIMLGAAPNGTGTPATNAYIAEVAIWDKVLAQADIESYLAKSPASGISASDLQGYWPLDYSSSTQSNEGVDSGGDITITGAVYSSDHPIAAALPDTRVIVPTGPVIP